MSIRLWHQDFDKNVILIPDIISYTILDPKSKPGLDNNLNITGWNIEKSYFSYVHNSYNTDFGISNYQGQYNFPEINYNVVLKREFVDPFISNLLPIIVIACILFAVMKTINNKEKGSGIPVNVLGICSGLLFTVLISHIELRRSIAVKEIIYLEYLYFLMYLYILLVIINSFIFGYGNNMKLVHYRDNLIPKIIFWPLFLVSMFVITIIVFY